MTVTKTLAKTWINANEHKKAFFAQKTLKTFILPMFRLAYQDLQPYSATRYIATIYEKYCFANGEKMAKNKKSESCLGDFA